MSLFESSSKGLKFDTVGATHTGVVQSAPARAAADEVRQPGARLLAQRRPKMQILVDLKTDQRLDASDTGERTLYVASKNLKRAIGEAIRAAGASDILPGGTLTVQYIGNDPASANPANPAKMYTAQYNGPDVGVRAAACGRGARRASARAGGAAGAAAGCRAHPAGTGRGAAAGARAAAVPAAARHARRWSHRPAGVAAAAAPRRGHPARDDRHRDRRDCGADRRVRQHPVLNGPARMVAGAVRLRARAHEH